MIVLKKINAGALQFVLFVGAIIAVLLMSFLLLMHTHKHFKTKTNILIALVESANYGMETSLKEDFAQRDMHTIYQETDIPLTINVSREFWGVFEKRVVETMHNTKSYTKTALVGAKDEGETAALYVNNHQRPVILAGNAQISGNAFLPEQGLKMGNIYGNSYNRPELLYGRQMKSDSILPDLSEDLGKQLQFICNPSFLPNGQIINSLPISGIANSFESETKIYKDRVIRLENIEITGNVVIIAAHKIVVTSSAKLKDIILIAPEIVVENWVKGNFQAIATETIYIGKKTELSYPSALVLNKKSDVIGMQKTNMLTYGQSPGIYLDAYAYVAGCVLALDNSKTIHTPLVSIDFNAKVLGEVYCERSLELKGRINGMVSTDSFIALENGNIYQNHLYNGVINSTRLKPMYAGILLKSRESNKKVMKWLY